MDNSYLGTKRGVNVPVTCHGEIVAAIGISGEPAEVACYAQMRI